MLSTSCHSSQSRRFNASQASNDSSKRQALCRQVKGGSCPSGRSSNCSRGTFSISCNGASEAQQTRSSPPPPPPPRPPPAPPSKFNASKRDFVIAGLGAVLGGGAMYFYDTFEINGLNDELAEMEDEQDYNIEIMSNAMQRQRTDSPSMADLEPGGKGASP